MPDYGKPIENDLNFNSLLDFFRAKGKKDKEPDVKIPIGPRGPKTIRGLPKGDDTQEFETDASKTVTRSKKGGVIVIPNTKPDPKTVRHGPGEFDFPKSVDKAENEVGFDDSVPLPKPPVTSQDHPEGPGVPLTDGWTDLEWKTMNESDPHSGRKDYAQDPDAKAVPPYQPVAPRKRPSRAKKPIEESLLKLMKDGDAAPPTPPSSGGTQPFYHPDNTEFNGEMHQGEPFPDPYSPRSGKMVTPNPAPSTPWTEHGKNVTDPKSQGEGARHFGWNIFDNQLKRFSEETGTDKPDITVERNRPFTSHSPNPGEDVQGHPHPDFEEWHKNDWAKAEEHRPDTSAADKQEEIEMLQHQMRMETDMRGYHLPHDHPESDRARMEAEGHKLSRWTKKAEKEYHATMAERKARLAELQGNGSSVEQSLLKLMKTNEEWEVPKAPPPRPHKGMGYKEYKDGYADWIEHAAKTTGSYPDSKKPMSQSDREWFSGGHHRGNYSDTPMTGEHRKQFQDYHNIHLKSVERAGGKAMPARWIRLYNDGLRLAHDKMPFPEEERAYIDEPLSDIHGRWPDTEERDKIFKRISGKHNTVDLDTFVEQYLPEHINPMTPPGGHETLQDFTHGLKQQVNVQQGLQPPAQKPASDPDWGIPKSIQNSLLKLMKDGDEQELNPMEDPPKENKESQALVADGDSKRPKSEVGTNDKMFKKAHEGPVPRASKKAQKLLKVMSGGMSEDDWDELSHMRDDPASYREATRREIHDRLARESGGMQPSEDPDYGANVADAPPGFAEAGSRAPLPSGEITGRTPKVLGSTEATDPSLLDQGTPPDKRKNVLHYGEEIGEPDVHENAVMKALLKLMKADEGKLRGNPEEYIGDIPGYTQQEQADKAAMMSPPTERRFHNRLQGQGVGEEMIRPPRLSGKPHFPDTGGVSQPPQSGPYSASQMQSIHRMANDPSHEWHDTANETLDILAQEGYAVAGRELGLPKHGFSPMAGGGIEERRPQTQAGGTIPSHPDEQKRIGMQNNVEKSLLKLMKADEEGTPPTPRRYGQNFDPFTGERAPSTPLPDKTSKAYNALGNHHQEEFLRWMGEEPTNSNAGMYMKPQPNLQQVLNNISPEEFQRRLDHYNMGHHLFPDKNIPGNRRGSPLGAEHRTKRQGHYRSYFLPSKEEGSVENSLLKLMKIEEPRSRQAMETDFPVRHPDDTIDPRVRVHSRSGIDAPVRPDPTQPPMAGEEEQQDWDEAGASRRSKHGLPSGLMGRRLPNLVSDERGRGGSPEGRKIPIGKDDMEKGGSFWGGSRKQDVPQNQSMARQGTPWGRRENEASQAAGVEQRIARFRQNPPGGGNVGDTRGQRKQKSVENSLGKLLKAEGDPTPYPQRPDDEENGHKPVKGREKDLFNMKPYPINPSTYTDAIQNSLLKIMKEGELIPSKVGMNRNNRTKDLEKVVAPQVLGQQPGAFVPKRTTPQTPESSLGTAAKIDADATPGIDVGRIKEFEALGQAGGVADRLFGIKHPDDQRATGPEIVGAGVQAAGRVASGIGSLFGGNKNGKTPDPKTPDPTTQNHYYSRDIK